MCLQIYKLDVYLINIHLMIPSFLLPLNLPLNASSIEVKGNYLVIQASAIQPHCACPACGHNSFRIHSKYIRMLADLPVSGHLVKVTIVSRKYFCDNPQCLRKIFTERFTGEIIPYQRRFNRSNHLLSNIALELGGNKGALISRLVGLPVSASTILRVIKRMSLKVKKVTSGIIGIDDWAFKKGATYGTIIVDLKENKVVDLLCDREAETVSLWLKEHPEVEVISRDRGGPYAKGGREGAPQAIQVADRFHLMMNLGYATTAMFKTLGNELKKAYMLYHNIEPPVAHTSSMKLLHVDHSADTAIILKNQQRQVHFDKVKELYSQGYPIRAIARSLHLHRCTIRKYLKTNSLPPKRGSKTSNFDSFQIFLLHEGNRSKTYMELYKMIKDNGFTGAYTQFCNNMNVLLRSHDIIPASAKSDPTPLKTWSARQLSWLIQKDKKDLKKEDGEFLELIYNKHPLIKETQEYISRFKKLFETKQDGALKKWINDVAASKCAMKGFAKGVLSDFDAVNNAVVMPYSNGQVEGQINRLKNIKRRMYGKAGFELLRRMVIFKSG